MRLVDIVPGQAAAGAGSVGASNRQQRKNLILSRPPANYTGPLALHTLLDKCFSTVVDSYVQDTSEPPIVHVALAPCGMI